MKGLVKQFAKWREMSVRVAVMLVMLMGVSMYAKAEEYITDIVVLGAEDSGGINNVAKQYREWGWTVVTSDLNSGTGGWYIYVAYKTSSSADPQTGYVTDICASTTNVSAFTHDGRTYHQAPRNSDFSGDLNRGAGKSTPYIYLYYTRDRKNLSYAGGVKRVMTTLSVTHSEHDGNSSKIVVQWRNGNYDGPADTNKGAGGDFNFIYMHFTTQTLKWKVEPTFASDFTYDATSKCLISYDPWEENYGIGNTEFRVNGGDWSTTRPYRAVVGTYKVDARLSGTHYGETFAEHSSIVSKTITINPPIARASNLSGVFNQGDKKVYLSWDAPSIVGGYSDYKWVVYRDGTKIAELPYGTCAYSDGGFTNEATPVYDVYYVSNFWDITTKRDDTKASVSVNTTRSVPIHNLMVDQQSDRIVFTWTSDAYPAGFGNIFRIYAENEDDPIYELTPADMQSSFQWEHRTTDQHTNRQNKVDAETGVPYTEEPLSACNPRTYRIDGVIGDAVLNSREISPKSVGEATKFYGLDASKGVYEGSVKLAWQVDQQGSVYAKTYIIERRRAEQENEAWETLTRLSSNEEYLFYTDETALPGVYYDYRVTIEDKCPDGSIVNSEATNIGFAKSTGTVTGRIAYGSTGTAVKGVEVVMTMTDSEGEDAEQYHSIYFSDASGAVTWQYPDEDYANELFNGDFSIQLWLYPESFRDSRIAHFGGNTGLGMTADGHLTFSDGTTTHTFESIILQKERYNHVALTYNGTTLRCYVLGGVNDSIQKDSLSLDNSPWPLTGVKRFELGHFKGAVDEFRLWKKCLSENDIKDNYDHLLVGNEQQLETYWTFDEGLRTQFFDYSRDGSNYHKHHGLVGSNAMSSTLTPEALKLKAKTDANGNYVIQGIPFSGAGTTYTVVPLYGIHEFNPNMLLRYIGANSLVHTADFEDVSSFPMTGHIYYAGTNIPVEGVQFYVDGELQSSEGAFVTTDANGYYSLSVPIGEHYVEVKLPGHTMVAGGRYPTVGKFNFTDRVQHDFLDSTLVNFVGRVAGGTANDTLPVGFRASKNNIGTATITLRLNNESFSFNVQDKDHSTPATTDRYFESDTSSIQSHAWTEHGAAESKYIYITTDSATGEFSAKLPPLKYIVRSVEIKSHDAYEFLSLPEIDLTSVQKVQKDSMKVATEEGDSVWNYFSYNTKMVQTYFAEPQVSLWQVNGDGGFGEKELKAYAVSSAETMDITDIWTKDEVGKVHYTYGFPVFGRKMKYKFGLFGYEAYSNYDSGKAVTDTIPMNGQVLTIANEMSDEQDVVARVIDPTLTDLKQGDIYNLKSNQVRLDKVGRNEITFTTGAPNVTAPYTRQFSIAFVRNKRTYTGPQLNGVVLGELTNGNNFVTQGPDHVDMVLRDPPGAKGKTTWKTGTSWTKIDYETNGAYWDETMTADLIWGANLETAIGMGVAIISSSKATTTMVVGESGSFSWQWKDDKTYVYTSAENISTSTSSKYVGANGDIFIGKSHNFIIGTCRKLGFHQEGDSIVLGLKEAVNIGDSIATDFMFTALEIKETMIPKLIETRNALLEYMNETSAKAFTNTTDKDIYLTWLTPDNPNYGTKDTYVWKQGTKGKSQDLVLHYNESVRLWKERLAENEKDKIEAIQGSQYLKGNRSFDGGTAYTYTERRDTTKTATFTNNLKVGAVYELKTELDVNSAATFGANFNLKTSVGYTGSRVTGDSLDNTKSYVEFDYELNDGNEGTDFTVDIYRSPRGWSDLFLLRGGQSYNPYERMEYAEYYEPENQHVISYGTQQMEQPILQISTDGNVGVKSAMLTDVPAGQEGQFTLHVTNGSTTNQSIPFGYDLKISEATNTKGLEILMDGTPINGRTLWIPKGETVKKIISVRQTDQSVLDYDSVELYLFSMYQPGKISDHVTLAVHFMPSSSPVELTVTNPVINTDPTTGNGKLSLKLSGFNRQFKNLKNIGIQYRFAGNTQWTTLHTWVTNIADSTSKSFSPLPATGDIRWTEDMSNNTSYPEGEYEFRAFTTTPYGNEPVQVFSEVTTVVKDMTKPRPLFTPAPANGILGIGEQLAVEFNEDIVPGYVGDKNIIITAKLNGRPINHEVSLHLLPFGQEVQTVNPVFLNGNFSLEFWVNLHGTGTIFHQGAGNGNFALSLDNDGHVVLSVVGRRFTSTATLPQDEWIFVAMNYKAETMTFNMLAQYGETTVNLFSNETVPMEQVEVVDYTEDNYLYLGPINANIHNLALYNIYRDVTVAASNKYVSKDAYTYGLTNYWPMNEGHGFVAVDARHTHDFTGNKDSWDRTNLNYSLRMDTTIGVTADISLINTTRDDSYAIELWYQSSILHIDTLFETDNLRLRFDTLHNYVLDYGDKSKIVVNNADFDDILTGWHHLALNVVRGQAASFYLDGKRTAVIAEADVPAIKGATLTLLKGGEITFIDELRIWKATLSEDRLLSNMYNTIDTSDVYARGLIAYYPFEKDSVINGVATKGETLQNMAPRSKTGNAGDVVAAKSTMLKHTPPLKNAPSETRITAVPVSSERKVVINLAETEVNARDIEGTTLNVTLAEVHDLHGNISNPIKWTAYVKQNTLKWLKDSVNIFKPYGTDYSFDVNIENLSGQIEYYTIANMPEWLTLDGSLNEDDVQPLKTKTLRFAVNPYVPVNDYDVTIGLQGNNEILEPLRIVMQVRGETPDWTVDPTLYDHSMTVIGQVYLGGILMENPESMVAAFIGGECRGVAIPEKTRGAAFVTLPIYGHDTSKKDAGKAVSFRIWDASRGIAYTDAQIAIGGKDTTIVFHDGVLVGNFDNPAIWTKSDKVEQLVSIHENWNWIALGVEPENPTCSQLFKDYMGWNILVKDTGSYSQTNGSEWKGTLAPHANQMYKMKIARTPSTQLSTLNTQLAVRGQQKGLYEMPVTLEKGWNWMPYTPLTTKRIEPALAGANPKKGDIVKSQTAVAIYGTNRWEGTLTALEPGHGYLYFSVDSLTRSFVYPEETYVPHGMLGAPMRNVKSQMVNLQWFNPVDKHTYPSNMTMTIRLLDGDAVVDTCEIAAFVGDECRGAVRADQEGLYYLVIAGEGAGQAMEIKAVIDGEIRTIDNTQVFVSDEHIGTPWEPYVIQLNPAQGIEITPSPSGEGRGEAPRKEFRNGILYILRGGKIYTASGAEVR